MAGCRSGASDAPDGEVTLETVRRRADLLAHDLTNLLTTILGYGNLLSGSLAETDPRRADAEEIVAAAQRAAALVRELEGFGRQPDASPGASGADVATPCPPHHDPADTAARVSSAPSAARILVVDDERTVRYLVRTILGRTGHDVYEAATAEDAERWLADQPAPMDLLIADLVLPGSSGPELLTRLRLRQPSLKVLFISGYPDEQIRRDPRIAAGTPFVQKPFAAEALANQVERVLSS